MIAPTAGPSTKGHALLTSSFAARASQVAGRVANAENARTAKKTARSLAPTANVSRLSMLIPSRQASDLIALKATKHKRIVVEHPIYGSLGIISAWTNRVMVDPIQRSIGSTGTVDVVVVTATEGALCNRYVAVRCNSDAWPTLRQLLCSLCPSQELKVNAHAREIFALAEAGHGPNQVVLLRECFPVVGKDHIERPALLVGVRSSEITVRCN